MMDKIRSAYIETLANYYNAKFSNDLELKWRMLEHAHIFGQSQISRHFNVHFLMLREAVSEKNLKEVTGQIFRILLVPIGHLFGKLPKGNIGTSKVSAFKEMEIPKEVKDLLE